MTTLDPKTIAAGLMTDYARDVSRIDIAAYIGQAYDDAEPTTADITAIADLIATAGIDLLWPDGSADTELDAQRVENERLRAHRDELRARIDAAHDALSRLDGVDEDSTATLETTVRYLADRWQHLCDAEAEAAAEVDRLRAAQSTAPREAEPLTADVDLAAWCADTAASHRYYEEEELAPYPGGDRDRGLVEWVVMALGNPEQAGSREVLAVLSGLHGLELAPTGTADELDRVRAERDDDRAEMQELRAELAEAHAQCRRLNRELDDVRAELAAAEERAASMRAALDADDAEATR
ncbi:hypothetical protein [Micromonospora haikouensis]|uniref:hypothetical protein n=1 Tax=Micromonospora haikouensis TaxID=686309 RepID=UPI003D72BC6E